MAGRLLASAYQGPPPLTLTRALESWTLDLPVLLAVLAAGVLYLGGARRARAAGQSWPGARTAAFLAGGLGTLAIATMSFLGAYQGVLFWVRAAQTVLLLLLVPLFLALARPLTLTITGLPRLRGPVERLLASGLARVLTFPAVTALVLVIMPFLLYFTPWYAASLASRAVGELTRPVLIGCGLVFFWTLLRVDPVPKAYSYLVSLWVTGMEVVADAVLGLAVIADQHLIAGGYYRALGRPWAPGLRTDQVLGGGALWLLGDLVGVPFFAAQLIQMIREDEREAARIDAELDAALPGHEPVPAAATAGEGSAAESSMGEGSAAEGSTGEGSAAEGSDAAPAALPWWERDPRFTGRFSPPASG